jgi:hypothetical protein
LAGISQKPNRCAPFRWRDGCLLPGGFGRASRCCDEYPELVLLYSAVVTNRRFSVRSWITLIPGRPVFLRRLRLNSVHDLLIFDGLELPIPAVLESRVTSVLLLNIPPSDVQKQAVRHHSDLTKGYAIHFLRIRRNDRGVLRT